MSECHLSLPKDTIRKIMTPPTAIRSEVKLHIGEDQLRIYASDNEAVTSVTVTLDYGGLLSIPNSEISTRTNAIAVLECLSAMKDCARKIDVMVGGDMICLTSRDMRCKRFLEKKGNMNILSEPDTESKAVFTFRPEQVLDVLMVANWIGHNVTVIASEGEDTFSLVAEGLKIEDNVLKRIEPDSFMKLPQGTVRSTFNIAHFLEIIQVLPDEHTVRFSLRNDRPASLEYSFADGFGKSTFILRTKM